MSQMGVTKKGREALEESLPNEIFAQRVMVGPKLPDKKDTVVPMWSLKERQHAIIETKSHVFRVFPLLGK
jgi:molybdopterin biosynthesis enzyme